MTNTDTELKEHSLVVVIKDGVWVAIVSRVHRSDDGFPLIFVKDDDGKEHLVTPAEVFLLAQTDETFKTPSVAIKKLWKSVFIQLTTRVASALQGEGLTAPNIQKGSLVVVPTGASERVKNDCIGLVEKILPGGAIEVRIGLRSKILVESGKLTLIIDTEGGSRWPARVFQKYLPRITILLWTKLEILEMMRKGKMLALNTEDLQVLLPICFGRPKAH